MNNAKLTLTSEQAKQSMLALIVCRNSVKKGFKSSYGFFEGRKKIEIYDNVKDKFISFFDESSEEKEYHFHLSSDELTMLGSFLIFYIAEINQDELTTETQFKILNELKATLEKVQLLDQSLEVV